MHAQLQRTFHPRFESINTVCIDERTGARVFASCSKRPQLARVGTVLQAAVQAVCKKLVKSALNVVGHIHSKPCCYLTLQDAIVASLVLGSGNFLHSSSDRGGINEMMLRSSGYSSAYVSSIVAALTCNRCSTCVQHAHKACTRPDMQPSIFMKTTCAGSTDTQASLE